jgi:hypothetical protein
LLVGLGALATACETPGSAQTPVTDSPPPVAGPPTIVPAVTRAPSTTPQPLVLSEASGPETTIDVRPLAELSPDAALNAGMLGDGVGIAVYVPAAGAVYALNGDVPFELASVIKVPLMLTLLDQVTKQGRELTPGESALLGAMITESDNNAADVLFDEVGGARPIYDYLKSIGLGGAIISSTDWGASQMSAMDAALLMGKLVNGDILDPKYRDLAMSLLENVDPIQDWGAVDSVSYARTGVKNGWYPERDGWVLNSLGYVLDSADSPDCTIAIFTDEQIFFYDGVSEIQSLGQLVHQSLASGAQLPTSPRDLSDSRASVAP